MQALRVPGGMPWRLLQTTGLLSLLRPSESDRTVAQRALTMRDSAELNADGLERERPLVARRLYNLHVFSWPGSLPKSSVSECEVRSGEATERDARRPMLPDLYEL